MAAVQTLGTSEREADAVERDRVVVSKRVEVPRGGAASEVVLRGHLEPGDGRARGDDLADVRRAKADPRRGRDTGAVRSDGDLLRAPGGPRRGYDRFGWRLPSTSRSQVPFGT